MSLVRRLGARVLQWCLMGLVLSIGSGLVRAQEAITVLLSEEGGSYTEFSSSLAAALEQKAGGKTALKLVTLGDPKFDEIVRNNSSQLLVAVGVPAMSALAKKTVPMPVLNVLVTRASFQKGFIRLSCGSLKLDKDQDHRNESK